MRKIWMVLLIFTGNIKQTNVGVKNYYFADNFSTRNNIASIENPFRIKPNTEYTFYYYEDNWSDSDYYQKLRENNIIKEDEYARFEVVTSTKRIEANFSIYQNKLNYVSFKTMNDDYYIYAMSFLSTYAMLPYYHLIEGDVEKAYNGNLNCLYEGDLEGEIPFDYTCSYDVSDTPTLEEIRKSFNIDEDVKVIHDNYTMGKVGKYKIIYYKMVQNDVFLYRVEIELTDNLPPTITGKNSYITDIESVITEKEILDALVITDNYITYPRREIIYNGYLGNEKKPGQYYVKVKSSDVQKNETIYDIVINVYFSLSEAFCLNGKEINKLAADNLSEAQIIALITNHLNEAELNYQNLSCDFSLYKEKEVGEYEIPFSYIYNDEKIYDSLKICVKENKEYIKGDYHTLTKSNNYLKIIYLLIIIITIVVAIMYYFWFYFKHLIVDKLFRK